MFDDVAFDNLLPSTIGINRAPISKKRPYGLSSSVLLPSSKAYSEDIAVSKTSFQIFNNPLNVETTRTSPTTTGATLKDRLIDVSNLASFLCVLDCTLLPLVSIAIPALSFISGGLTATTAASNPIMFGLSMLLSHLPAVGHNIALYFVIPVGVLTTMINYLFGHREIRFSLAAFLGVMLIYLANSSLGSGVMANIDSFLSSHWGIMVPAVPESVAGAMAQHVHHGACGAASATSMAAHACAEGWAHRMINTLGCAFLLGSNYASRKFMEEKNEGCAASVLAEAWGGVDGGVGKVVVCGPACDCEGPSYSKSGGRGEMFFQWERTTSVRGGGERGKVKSSVGTGWKNPFPHLRR